MGEREHKHDKPGADTHVNATHGIGTPGKQTVVERSHVGSHAAVAPREPGKQVLVEPPVERSTGRRDPRSVLHEAFGIGQFESDGPPKKRISAALDALASRTRNSLKFLEGSASDDFGIRRRVIDTVTADIAVTVDAVQRLLDEIPVGERAGIETAADGAALAIGKLLRWVRQRPNHASLEATLLAGVRSFDAVLTTLGADTIGDRDAVPLSENQVHAADEENKEFDQAMEEVDHVIDAYASDQAAGIHAFQMLAALADQAQPDFKQALAAALIDETVKTLLGSFAKAFAASPRRAPVTAPSGSPSAGADSGGGVEKVFEIGFSSVKAAIDSKLQVADAQPQMSGTPKEVKVDARLRALTYFCRGLHIAETERARALKDNVSERKKASSITAAQLRDITAMMEDRKKELVEHQFQQLVKGWTQYMARARLGVKTFGHDKVSDMSDYFGERKGHGRVFGTSKAGGDGVLSIVMTVENGKPTMDHDATKVIGINSELTHHLFAAANNQFDRIELPKEVHVHSRFARATIALDERNHIRDVRDWDQMLPHVGGMTAPWFWMAWGKNLKVKL